MAAVDIANDLVNLCRQGQFKAAIDKHYGDNIVSVECIEGTPEMPSRLEGIEAVRGKYEWWVANHEIHGVTADGPFVGGNQFAVRFHSDVTPRATGRRRQRSEMALYTVENDKIVLEEFYYNMPGA